MRQYFSVMTIAARSTIYKMICLLFLMSALETVLFLRLLRQTAAQPCRLEAMITLSKMPLVCGGAFVILCALLSLAGCERWGSKCGYTLRRLSVGEGTTALLWAFYNSMCFLVFWAVQLLTALLLCRVYVNSLDPAYWNDQTIFMAFYRSDFLHGLLPMAAVSIWLRNGALIAALGAASSSFSMRQRRGERGIAIVVLAVLTLVAFPRQIDSFVSDIITLIIALCTAVRLCFDMQWGRFGRAPGPGQIEEGGVRHVI